MFTLTNNQCCYYSELYSFLSCLFNHFQFSFCLNVTIFYNGSIFKILWRKTIRLYFFHVYFFFTAMGLQLFRLILWCSVVRFCTVTAKLQWFWSGRLPCQLRAGCWWGYSLPHGTHTTVLGLKLVYLTSVNHKETMQHYPVVQRLQLRQLQLLQACELPSDNDTL